MKKKILAGLLLAGGMAFAAPRVSFGIGIGAPAPVVVEPQVVSAVPPCPGPGYEFINGYWQFVGTTVVVHDRDNFRRAPVVRNDRDHFRDGDHFRR